MLSREYREDRKALITEKRELKESCDDAKDIANQDSTFTKEDIKGLKHYCKDEIGYVQDDIKDLRQDKRKDIMYKVKRPFVKFAYKIGLKKKKFKTSKFIGGGGAGNGLYSDNDIKYTHQQQNRYDSLMNVVRGIHNYRDEPIDIVLGKQLMIEYEFVLVTDYEDMLSKNPMIQHLVSEEEDFSEEFKRGFHKIRFNRNIIEELYVYGMISQDRYEEYVQRVMKGEVFELEYESPDTYYLGRIRPTVGAAPDEIAFEENNSISYIPNIENMEIVDNANDDSTSSKGTIAYSVPKEMMVGEEYRITLRITKQKGAKVERTLILGEREIPISDTNIDSKVVIENIRVERSMSAELLSEDGAFKITALNTEKNQIVEDESYTEWGWVVVPLKSGTSYLKMIIKIKVISEGETFFKEIVVFDKNIEVKSNVKMEVKSWLSQYWQWLMTTIIIPLVVFFYKRKKGEKKEENK